MKESFSPLEFAYVLIIAVFIATFFTVRNLDRRLDVIEQRLGIAPVVTTQR